MIKFSNVTKIYKNGHKALDNISFAIEKGEFVFLTGQSGAGKSTIIKMLILEERPTEGQVIIGENSLDDITRRNIASFRRKMGVVFQDFRLLTNKTVYDNVAFALRIMEESQKSIRKKVPSILHSVGLSGKSKCFPGELSGGEQQRVAIARALVNNPPLLICDEPTGNLDTDTSMEIMQILSDINANGTTVIMATHAMDIVKNMRKRVINIDRGIIIEDKKMGREIEDENKDYGAAEFRRYRELVEK